MFGLIEVTTSPNAKVVKDFYSAKKLGEKIIPLIYRVPIFGLFQYLLHVVEMPPSLRSDRTLPQ